jgi:hypothetical protein
MAAVRGELQVTDEELEPCVRRGRRKKRSVRGRAAESRRSSERVLFTRRTSAFWFALASRNYN